jgi:hypothetical protein
MGEVVTIRRTVILIGSERRVFWRLHCPSRRRLYGIGLPKEAVHGFSRIAGLDHLVLFVVKPV